MKLTNNLRRLLLKHMNDDFSGLIKYLDEKFGEINEDLRGLKNDFNNLQSSVDAYAKKADTYFQEMVMLSHKIDRHEKWIQQVADKVGIKLSY